MSGKDKSIRRRYSAQERAEIIAAYERSGLTQAVFVEKRGISLATLSNWLRAHRRKDKGATKEISFQSLDVKGLFASQWAAEVVMPNGSMLRLASVDGALAERLTKVLRRAC
jgi:transposase-like protein